MDKININNKLSLLKDTVIKKPSYCLFLMFFIIANSIIAFSGNYYSLWTDRDFFRGYEAFRVFEPLGAELSFFNGDRVPGGLMNYIWGIALNIYPDMFSIVVLKGLLSLCAIFYFTRVLLLKYSYKIVFPVIVLMHYSIWDVVSGLWNPMMSFIFSLFSIAYFLKSVIKNDDKFIKYSFLFAFMAMQMHLSSSILLVNLLLYVIYKKINIKEVLYIVLFFLLNYFLYFIYDYQHDFYNTKNLFLQFQTIDISIYNIISFLLLFGFLLILKSKSLSNIISLVFFGVIISSFFLSQSKYIEYIDKTPLHLNKSYCENTLFKCINVNNEKDITFTNNIMEKKSVWNNIQKYTESKLTTKHIWGKNGEEEKIFYYAIKNKNDYTIIYHKHSNIMPLINMDNVKAILQLNIIPFSIFLLAIITFYFKKKDESEQFLFNIILVEILVYFFIYCRTFNIHLDSHSNRYLFTNIIYLNIFVLLFCNTIMEFYHNIKNKFGFLNNFNNLSHYIGSIFILYFLTVVSVDFYNDNDNTYNEIYMINKIKESTPYIKEQDIYFNIGFYDNKTNSFFHVRNTKSFYYDINNNYIPKKMNTCFILSTNKISEFNNELNLPRRVDIGYFYNQHSQVFNLPFVISNNKIKNSTFLFKFSNYNNEGRIMDLYAYKVNLEKPGYCFQSFSNRYAFNSLERKEIELFHKNQTLHIEKNKEGYILQNIHDSFVYSLVFNKDGIVLSSNQLRGLSYNYGYLSDYTLINPKISINGNTYQEDTVIGLIGHLTPHKFDFNMKKINTNLKKGDIIVFEYNLYGRDKFQKIKDTFIVNQ